MGMCIYTRISRQIKMNLKQLKRILGQPVDMSEYHLSIKYAKIYWGCGANNSMSRQCREGGGRETKSLRSPVKECEN